VFAKVSYLQKILFAREPQLCFPLKPELQGGAAGIYETATEMRRAGAERPAAGWQAPEEEDFVRAGSTEKQVRSEGHAPEDIAAGARDHQPRGLARLFLVAALLSVALIALAASTALGATSTEYLRSFGPDGTEATSFETNNAGTSIAGVGVDQQTGAVYVLDLGAGALYQFDAKGHRLDFTGTAPYISENEITGIVPESFYGTNEAQVAVDSTRHIVYVTEKESVRAFQENGEPAEFTAGPGVGTSEIPGFTSATGVAVDANGNIYVSDYAGTVSVYAPDGTPLSSFPMSRPGNLAVGPDGTVYVDDSDTSYEGGGIHRFVPDPFPVTAGTTYTEGTNLATGEGFAEGVAVDAISGEIYVSKWGSFGIWVAVYDEAGALLREIGKAGEEGEFKGTPQGLGVVAGGEEFQLYAGDLGTSQVRIFGERINPGPPSIESTSVSDVTATSATLRARINPNTFATSYRFEYGLGDCSIGPCASVPLGGAGIGDGHHGVTVSQEIAGLQVGTTYHYRVVAENPEGITEGPDHTFTTQLSGLGFQLADQRAWEMVSPPKKLGARLVGVTGARVQAARDGNGLVYPSIGSIEANPEGNRIVEPSTILARRGPAGWSSRDITAPNEETAPVATGNIDEYKIFSPDLSKAILEPRSHGPLSPEASERTPYLRQDTEPPLYTPLVTGKEGYANVPPGTEFGGPSDSGSGLVRLAGATADLSHAVLVSSAPLTPEGPKGDSLYEWTAGRLSPVSVLPPEEGGTMIFAPQIGSSGGSTRHAISEDGSRVFWTNAGPLYLRYNATEAPSAISEGKCTEPEKACTVRLDVVAGGTGDGSATPVFQGASADGTVVFFTDKQQLTAGASPEGSDLYRCEIPDGSPAGGCATLTDISAPFSGSEESAEVQALVTGMSDAGTTVYFVANGVLDNSANGVGANAVHGQPNLYVWQEGSGTRFIATLSGKDGRDWNFEGEQDLSAATSPDGRYLSFMSSGSLTGYDNTAKSGEPVVEVFRYDALADQLGCISCNPSGAVPDVSPGPVGESLTDPYNSWSGQTLAAILPPPAVSEVGGVVLYHPRAVLDNGRVFFNALDALVPADSNGQWDVYQYEPSGGGDCTSSSGGAAVARSAGGCVSLISSGTAEEEAGFFDASSSGDDVFFLTSAQLNEPDQDREYDIYDARVNGVPAKLTPRVECLGEACQPAVEAPVDQTPASSSFKGRGNLHRKHCSHNKVRRGSRCVKRHGRRRHHHRAGAGRRAGR
jgi:hypothetical protein